MTPIVARARPLGLLPVAVALLVLAAGVPAGAQDAADELAVTRFRAIERAVVEVVQKVRPATVAILALRRVEFEGNTRYAAMSGGSGVIIDPDGYIVTNDHVAGHCDALQVVLAGGRKVPAELVAKDEKGDIALLKIEGRRLPAVPLGDSGKVQVGEWVLAVGNPFFLGARGEPVVTVGVVSGKNRVLGGRWEYTDSIQIDAAINPGNSGGPLFNLKGELIGINGKIATREGVRANTGAGYAIPVDVVKSFLPRLRRGQDIERGYSGLMLDSEPVPRGVRVKAVARGSPADEQHLKEGDIILSVNGRTVNNAREYINLVSPLTAGKILTLQVNRQGRTRAVRITLAVDPARQKAAEARKASK
ncbi:MAG: trypsin-like peptidase domain-containing protein [Planctomycetes bacterium]|nr:trypsin-like peptidase domain-containing protein [Planctomycetota bacterium]